MRGSWGGRASLALDPAGVRGPLCPQAVSSVLGGHSGRCSVSGPSVVRVHSGDGQPFCSAGREAKTGAGGQVVLGSSRHLDTKPHFTDRWVDSAFSPARCENCISRELIGLKGTKKYFLKRRKISFSVRNQGRVLSRATARAFPKPEQRPRSVPHPFHTLKATRFVEVWENFYLF